VIEVDDFFTGFLESALEPDELLTEIRVPKVPDAGWSFQKFNRRAQDWAIVGVACVRNGSTGVGLVNMGSTPLRAGAVESALDGGADAAAAAEHAADDAEPQADLNASVEYRTHLAKVLTRRALDESAASS
jgi:carbon-monoxide dehydrogenase medium subunit